MPSRNPLVQTLAGLRGNTRACVYTEPLWGVPYNLFVPYASLYMLALGVTSEGIGLVASLGMAGQILFSFLSGALTDKYGRRWTTFFVDLVSWSIPCLLWAFAQDIRWFVAAALFNAVNRVAQNSWGCLLVEDSDRSQIVNIYAWVYISGVVAAFFAPLAGLFVGRYDVVPTVRFLYLLALVLMTAKFVLLLILSRETEHGKVRLKETRGVPLAKLLSGYGGVLGQILRSPGTLLTLVLMFAMSVVSTVNASFWSVFATEQVHVEPRWIGLFPFVRSLVMLLVFFTLVPRIRALRFRRPMLLGILVFAGSQGLLLASASWGLPALFGSSALEALGIAMVNPLLDSMQVVLVDPKERARIISILYVAVLALGSPFGWIAGRLSLADPRMPFLLNLSLLGVAFVATALVSRARSLERM